jgi:hypothetical protein
LTIVHRFPHARHLSGWPSGRRRPNHHVRLEVADGRLPPTFIQQDRPVGASERPSTTKVAFLPVSRHLVGRARSHVATVSRLPLDPETANDGRAA